MGKRVYRRFDNRAGILRITACLH